MLPTAWLWLLLYGATLSAALSRISPRRLAVLASGPRHTTVRLALPADDGGNGGYGGGSDGGEARLHPQHAAPFVDALQREAGRVQAPFFFPGHGMGSGLAPTDPLYPLGSGARALLQVYSKYVLLGGAPWNRACGGLVVAIRASTIWLRKL